MDILIWNIALTAVLAFIGYVMKEKSDEIHRIGILINKTREEVARDHVTRAEMNTLVDRLGDRFDRAFERLEAKVDEMRKV